MTMHVDCVTSVCLLAVCFPVCIVIIMRGCDLANQSIFPKYLIDSTNNWYFNISNILTDIIVTVRQRLSESIVMPHENNGVCDIHHQVKVQ